MTVRVGIVGFGTIGKRIADAISKQDDMTLTGVFKVNPDYSAEIAIKKGYKLFVPRDKIKEFEIHGFKVYGTLEDLIDQSDIIVDASPAGCGARNKIMYEKYGKVQIFQGGEKASIAELSFNALANYETAYGKRSLRVVSCNTTGIVRILAALIHNNINIRKVRVFIVRRGSDPREHKRGPINDVVLESLTVPSHHAHDVKTIYPYIDIVTYSVSVPVTLMHVHMMLLETHEPISRNTLIEALETTPRIVLVKASRGFVSIAQLIEWARDVFRERNDIPEVVVFEETVSQINDRELMLVYAVHQESIVIPENIDAVRAVLGLMPKWDSIKKTDQTLGLISKGKRYG